HVQEGVHTAIHGLDPVQMRLGQLHAGDLAGSELVGQLASTQAGEVTHASSPRICGTANIESAAAGAWSRACSGVRVSVTASARSTLLNGIGCEVGGTSSPTTSATLATACTITSSSP